MYRIKGWFPNGNMSGAGFSIILTPEWKDAVSKSEINQEGINNLIENLGNKILEGHGRNPMEKTHAALLSLGNLGRMVTGTYHRLWQC